MLEKTQIEADEEILKKAHEAALNISNEIMNAFTSEYQAVVVSCIMKNMHGMYNEVIQESKHKFEMLTTDYTAFLNALELPEIGEIEERI